MTTAYWCVLVTMILPYIWVLIARIPGFTLERNLVPRIVSDSLTGIRQRSYWAHQNALEIIAPFAATVIIAHLLNVEQDRIDNLALAFIGFRVAHAMMYMANQGVLRSLMFVGGVACMITLFVAGA